MITNIKLTLKAEKKVNEYKSLIYLSEMLKNSLSNEFNEHIKTLKYSPYTHKFYYRNDIDKYIWEVCVLTKDIEKEVIGFIEEKKEIIIMQSMEKLEVIKKEKHNISYEQIIDLTKKIEGIKTVEFVFLTTTVFVVNKKEVWLPKPKLIYENLLNKWNYFSLESKIDAPNLVEVLSENSKIHNFEIRSVEKNGIKGFIGNISYKVDNIELLKIIYLLKLFSVYCGVGEYVYKGMGGVYDNKNNI